jgi:8-oxo-dGTP pyrophosphatase MutT (NUDIX family)
MQPAAIAIIFSSNGKEILFIKRRDTPIWVLPGGGIDPGEEPCDAVVREVLEETGLHCRVVREVGYYFPKNRLSKEVHTFLCETIEGELVPCPVETLQAGFYSPSEVPGLLLPVHRHWIADALRDLEERIEGPVPGVSYWQLILFCLRHPWVSLRYGLRWDFWRRFF